MERRLDDIAANVKARMQMLGWSAPVLAKRAGISAKTLNNVLNARHAVQFDMLCRIADALGLQVWQLSMPQFPPNAADDASFPRLVRTAAGLDREARARVAHMADLEAAVTRKG